MLLGNYHGIVILYGELQRTPQCVGRVLTVAEPLRTLAAFRFAGRSGSRFILKEVGGAGRLLLTLLDSGLLRVQLQPLGHATVPRTWAVVGSHGDAPQQGRDREDLSAFSCPEPARVVVGDATFTLATERFTVTADLANLALRVTLPDGSVLARDHPTLAYRTATNAGTRGIRHTLVRDLSEAYLGLGEASGPLNRHHRRFRLRPTDALGYDALNSDPLYKHILACVTLTRQGHAVGIVYDTGAEAVFDFGSQLDNYHGYFRYTELAARELDYYVLVGPSVAEVVRGIQQLTGFAPLPPRWTLGYQGSTMSYTDAEDPGAALAGFTQQLERHGLACGAFNLSSGYSLGDDGLRYVFEWNRRRVPDPPAMLEPLKSAGIRTLANIKPAILCSHPQYSALAVRGAFVRSAQGDDPWVGGFWGGPGSQVDFTNPDAYAWWVSNVRTRLLEHGIDATWNDNNEFQVTDDAAKLAAGEAGDLRPVLTLLMNMASRDAQRAHAPESRDYQLTRSGSLGMQRLAQTWSGDNYTSWRSLRYNLPMGLNMSLSGWANHGHDVGDFAGPTPDAELLLRWVEAGIFQPRFCIHSWNDDGSATEPWTHASVLPQVRRLMRFRDALVPYLYTLLCRSTFHGEPLTRPFVYAFQDWQPGRDESFAYMLGDALLVAPMLEPGSAARSLLLPPGRWLELQTGRVLAGGVPAELSAEPGWPPVLLREGHALPLGVPLQDAGGRGFRDPLAVDWLAFPDSSDRFGGELLWDDGLSRVESPEGVSTVRLNGTQSELDVRTSGAGLPVGFEPVSRVLVPGGGLGVEWFRETRWTEVC